MKGVWNLLSIAMVLHWEMVPVRRCRYSLAEPLGQFQDDWMSRAEMESFPGEPLTLGSILDPFIYGKHQIHPTSSAFQTLAGTLSEP